MCWWIRSHDTCSFEHRLISFYFIIVSESIPFSAQNYTAWKDRFCFVDDIFCHVNGLFMLFVFYSVCGAYIVFEMRTGIPEASIEGKDIPQYLEGILPKGPYLPCVSMAGMALLAGYPRSVDVIISHCPACFWPKGLQLWCGVCIAHVNTPYFISCGAELSLYWLCSGPVLHIL